MMIDQLKLKDKYKTKKKVNNFVASFFRTVLIIGLSFVILYPLIEALIPAITDYNYLGKPNSIWIPLKTGFLSFRIAIYLTNYWVTLGLTILYAASMMAIQVIISAIVGYGFANLRFRGSNIIFFLVILTIVIPPQVLMLPQYFHFQSFDILGIIKLFSGNTWNLLGKTGVLYLMSALGMGYRSGLFIFLFRQFFRGLPTELEEAAYIDGCGYIKTFFRIILPNATSIMITVGVFSFVWNYGDTFYTGLFGKSSTFLAQLLDERFTSINWVRNAFNELTMQPPGTQANPLLLGAAQGAAKLIFIAPLLILYFIIQRKFVQSFERSGIVG